MNKGIVLLTFAGFWSLVVGWLWIHEVDTTTPRTKPAASASASASAAPETSSETDDLGPGGGGGSDVGQGGASPDDMAKALDGGFDMPDGVDTPDLDDAPKSIRFGVILVTYKGQREGGAKKKRSRADAEAKAEELAAKGRDDWSAAVKEGDEGSSSDAGRMFRGVLEAKLEVALFSLEKDQVSDPIDTPRGYWVAKRLK